MTQLGTTIDLQCLSDGSILFITTDEPVVSDFYEFAYFIIDTVTIGSACYGHITGVAEDNALDFANHGTGTATPSGSGDSEILTVDPGEYWEFEDINFGSGPCTLSTSKYQSSTGTPVVKYKTATTQALLTSESWTLYTVPFTSTGWVKVRVEN